jgi:hypothetical protein
MIDPSLPVRFLRALELRSQVSDYLMKRRNVVACGVGYKILGDEQTTEPSIMVSVTKKEPAEALDPDDLVPAMVEDVPTDVVETGQIVAQAIDREGRVRPVRPGISIGHQDSTAGTLGAFVRRGDEVFILSNNHVLAMLNQAEIGDAILQPGPGDGGGLLDQIGKLAEYVPIRYTDEEPDPTDSEPVGEPKGCSAPLARAMSAIRGLTSTATALPVPLSAPVNYIDAAISTLADTVAFDPRIVDVGGLPLGIASPALGMRVIKSGRTTGLTQGTVMQVEVTVDVTYEDRVARYLNQIMCSPMSDRGDSGSLVLDFERNAVGLLFSGSDLVTVVNPIQAVLKAFKVDLLTETNS